MSHRVNKNYLCTFRFITFHFLVPDIWASLSLHWFVCGFIAYVQTHRFGVVLGRQGEGDLIQCGSNH